MIFPDISGRVALVTGANSGLGFEIARRLYNLGAHVVVAGRNEGRLQAAIEKIQLEEGSGSLEIGQLDLSDLSAVRSFAEGMLARHQRLDLLINNAGIMAPPATRTVDGFEAQFGVNFLGHFALTGHLYPLLEKTPGGRVVTMSSIAHRGASIDFENFRLEKEYSKWREYGQSKLADLYLAVEFHRRLQAKGSQVTSLAAHPGVTMTELTRHLGEPPPGVAFMTVEQGAEPALVAALSPEAVGGQYWGPNGPGEKSGEPGIAALDSVARDAEVSAHLWTWAESAIRVSFP